MTAKRGLESNPTSKRLRCWLAAAYAQGGQIDEAEWELDQVLLTDPALSRERFEKAYPFQYHADLKNFRDGLALAGLGE